MTRWLCLTTVILLASLLPDCTGGAKSGLGGKWEATITDKRNGTETKLLWEFLPDGTFTAAPLNDPTTLVDRDKYQVIDEGRTLKMRSQLIEDATLPIGGSTMTAETARSLIKFKNCSDHLMPASAAHD